MQYPATFAGPPRLMRTMLRSLLAAVVLALLLAPPAHAAKKPYAVESSRGPTLADGDRYAAWVHAGAVRVLDEQTGITASFPLPADCRPCSSVLHGPCELVAYRGKFDAVSGKIVR